MIKKADIILCLSVVAVMMLVITLITFIPSKGNSAVVTLNGKVYGRYNLNENVEISVKGERGYNTVVIENKEVYVKNADCRDQICVNHTHISNDGEIIVCLPHKMTVEIR